MNDTNAHDVLVVLIYCLTILGGLGIATYLVVEDHPWFALLVLIIAGSLKIKTGNPTP